MMGFHGEQHKLLFDFSSYYLNFQRDDGLPGRWQQPDGRHDRRRCRCGFPGAGEVIFLSIA